MKAFRGVALVAVCAVFALAEEAKEATTVKGEIVDLTAYLSKGRRGPEHSDATTVAIRGGAPAAVVTEDGTVYVLLVNGNEGKEPFKFAAHNVEITGIVHEKGGSRGILGKSVKDLGAVEAPR